MAEQPRLTLSGVVLDAPDPRALAGFYERLLGWRRDKDEADWVTVVGPHGGPKLSFQREPSFVRPRWPSTAEAQQMMVHLDVEVDDLEAAGRHAEACGATLAEYQPQDDVRVYLDPVGHPFCLFPPGS